MAIARNKLESHLVLQDTRLSCKSPTKGTKLIVIIDIKRRLIQFGHGEKRNKTSKDSLQSIFYVSKWHWTLEALRIWSSKHSGQGGVSDHHWPITVWTLVSPPRWFGKPLALGGISFQEGSFLTGWHRALAFSFFQHNILGGCQVSWGPLFQRMSVAIKSCMSKLLKPWEARVCLSHSFPGFALAIPFLNKAGLESFTKYRKSPHEDAFC